MTYFGRLRLWQKFVIVVGSLAIPSLVLLAMYEQSASENRHRKMLEVVGVEHATPATRLLNRLAAHRDLSIAVLGGAKDKVDDLRAQTRQVDEQFEALLAFEKANRDSYDLGDLGSNLRGEWQRLKGANAKLSTNESFNRHTELVRNTFSYLRRVGVVAGLRAETEPAMAGLQSAITESIPQATETLSRIRGVATVVATKGAMSDVHKNSLFSDLNLLRRVEKSLRDELGAVMDSDASLRTELAGRLEAWAAAKAALTERVENDILDVWPIAVKAQEVFALGTGAVEQTEGLWKTVQPVALSLLEERVSATERRMLITLLAVGSAILIGLVVAYIVTAGVSRRAVTAKDLLGRIEEGDLDNVIVLDQGDETSEILIALDSMQSQLRARIQAEREVAREVQQVKQAMDSSSSCVMITDAKHNIVYVNPALQTLLGHLADDMRTTLGRFDPHAVVGSNIDALRIDVGSGQGRHEERIEYGTRTVELTVNSVLDARGESVGSTVEWRDSTEELAAEEEVQRIVAGAKQGDLSGRILTDDKSGFYLVLGEGVNELLDHCDQVFTDTGRVMSAIARGDLTTRIERHYSGSFGDLKNDVNGLSDKLVEVLGDIKAGADSVASGASQLARGNDDLSQRTERQRSSLDETASSMEEITATVRQNADNAQEADHLATATRDQAEQGGQVMQDVVQSMEEIHSASGRIVDIIGVIDEIAFQTNLLALNAAVEAARAGEQGRGFAVVASEVRNLAGRSASAAKEIKELIQDSVAKVQDGSALVSKSRDVFDEIVSSVDKVTSVVAEIAAAGREQSLGIDQINHAITQMEKMTHENATLVRHGAEASGAMGEQAGSLNELVDFFDIGDSARRASAGSATSAGAAGGAPSFDAAEGAKGSYQGGERRSAARPWSGTSSSQPSGGSGSSPSPDEGPAEDADWDAF